MAAPKTTVKKPSTAKKAAPVAAAAKKKAAPAPIKKPTKRKSEEKVVDSESESESEEEAETQQTTTTATVTEGESESESESGSEEEETETGSESGSEESGSDEEDEEEEIAASAQLPKGSYKYAPPPSFKLVSASASGTANPFSAANLNGKELWFITAPLAAPLSKVDRISPADIAEGLPVLMTSSGRSYCLRSKDDEDEGAGEEVDLFVAQGGGYRLAGKKISKSFQMVEALPTNRVVTEEMVKSKPVKEQPEGLKMRFKPIGFEGEIDGGGDGDVKMRDVKLEVRPAREATAAGSEGHKKKKRRTHDEKEDRKEKKHRRKSNKE